MDYGLALEYAALIPAGLCVMAMIRWRRHEFIPIHRLVFLALALGAVGISLFYHQVNHGENSMVYLINLSRLLWTLNILLTSLVAISLLVYRR